MNCEDVGKVKLLSIDKNKDFSTVETIKSIDNSLSKRKADETSVQVLILNIHRYLFYIIWHTIEILDYFIDHINYVSFNQILIYWK